MSIGISYRDASGRERNFSFNDADSARSGLTDAGALGAMPRSADRKARNRSVFDNALAAAMADGAGRDGIPDAARPADIPHITPMEAPGFYPVGSTTAPSSAAVLGDKSGSSFEPDANMSSGFGHISIRVVTREMAIPIPELPGLVQFYSYSRVVQIGPGGGSAGIEEAQLVGIFSTVNIRNFAVRAFSKLVLLNEEGEEEEAEEDADEAVRVVTHLAFGTPDALAILPDKLPDEPSELKQHYLVGIVAIIPINPVLDYIDEEKKILIS